MAVSTKGLTSPIVESINGLETSNWDDLKPVVSAYFTKDHEDHEKIRLVYR